uniref:Secreted protein n=1 Tax=Mus musculus TaxID=10090 RepID=Q9CX23_MOUSE|nr:unnamed protein product [Mus musculus]
MRWWSTCRASAETWTARCLSAAVETAFASSWMCCCPRQSSVPFPRWRRWITRQPSRSTFVAPHLATGKRKSLTMNSWRRGTDAVADAAVCTWPASTGCDLPEASTRPRSVRTLTCAWVLRLQPKSGRSDAIRCLLPSMNSCFLEVSVCFCVNMCMSGFIFFNYFVYKCV